MMMHRKLPLRWAPWVCVLLLALPAGARARLPDDALTSLRAPAGSAESGSPAGWSSALEQVAKLVAADGAPNDGFGFAVAVDEQIAVVGASWADGSSLALAGDESHAGKAYLFQRHHGGLDAWGQVTRLVPSDSGAEVWYGCSVAVRGETVVVGALGAQVGGNVSQGAAYVFARDPAGSGPWRQVQKLTASDGGEYDNFGVSVAISEDGETIAVGAQFASAGGAEEVGAVYIFDRTAAETDPWVEQAKLVADDGLDQDIFGAAVSLSQDTVVVGADQASPHGKTMAGTAYIFARDEGGPGNWGQVARLAPLDAMPYDRFGVSVSISGDTALVGAHGVRVGDNPQQGAAYVFERDEGGADGWGRVQKLAPAGGAKSDHFGWSVAIGGDIIVVGAVNADVDGNSSQGAAHRYRRAQTGADPWLYLDRLIAFDGEATDEFGASVAISSVDSTIVVGAGQAYVRPNVGQGAAYVYFPPPLRVYLPFIVR